MQHMKSFTDGPSTLLPPISLLLANRPKLDQDGIEKQQGANQNTMKHIAHACPILINGQSMPWPLYSEQQVLQKVLPSTSSTTEFNTMAIS